MDAVCKCSYLKGNTGKNGLSKSQKYEKGKKRFLRMGNSHFDYNETNFHLKTVDNKLCNFKLLLFCKIFDLSHAPQL